MIGTDTICSEVELNKLTLLRPTLLLRYDKIIIDKSDYDEIRAKKDTGWRELLQKNLLFLESEGTIEIVDFKKEISEYAKHSIKKRGEEIVKGLNRKQKKRLLLATWKDYIQYIEIKAFHTQGNELEYRKQRAFTTKLHKLYTTIEQDTWDDDEQDYILQSCFWKTLASTSISKRVNGTALHLANEYSPFVDYIKPITGSERITKIDDLVKHLYSLSLPSVRISNFNEQKAFIQLRKSKLTDYKNLCEQLEEILETFEEHGASLEDVKEYLNERWQFGYFSINTFYDRLGNVALLPEFLIQVIVKTFKYYFPGIPEPPIPSDLLKNTSKKALLKPLGSLRKSKEKWQVTFSSLFNEREVQRIRKHLLTEYTSKSDDDLPNWIENIGKVPWYADSKYD
ncbi:MAG: hypothetical protein RIM99_09770 [Cyclobacteriaceae bacterium]